ncbi:MAG: glycosyltransferase N-terminal domain-containing protein [Pyrinomonadaceae bacterium]
MVALRFGWRGDGGRFFGSAVEEAIPRLSVGCFNYYNDWAASRRETLGSLASQVRYFPLDFRWSVRRAIRRVRPSLVLLMETEVWPHFIRECSQRSIPVAIVNGRISPTSFKRYRAVRFFFRRVLNGLSLAIMQTAERRRRG